MNDNGIIIPPRDDQKLPAPIIEQVARMMAQTEQLMQGMANVMTAMNQRMEKLERQMELITPITGPQEKAIGEQIKQRAGELREQYGLDSKALPAISKAIRKDLKLAGGVRAIRELPRVEYPVYIERIALWDDYAVMRAIKKSLKS